MDKMKLLLLPGLAMILTAVAAGDPYPASQVESTFGYEALKAIIQSEKLGNPDEVLRYFSARDGLSDFLQQFVLLYHSASLQRADVSPEFPRIITYGGQLTLALTGRGKSYNRIEIIEYLPKEARFAFHVVDFNRPAAERFVDNPGICADCHGTPARPIWRTYPLWPGMYGADDDTLYEERAPIEAAHWKNFYRTNAHAGRYALFKLARERNYDKAYPRYALDGFTPFVPPMPLATRGGLGLSQFFSHLNSMRIEKELVRSRLWAKYKYALTGALLDCENIASFFPSGKRSKDYGAIHADTLTWIRANTVRKESLYRRLSGSRGPARPSLDTRIESDEEQSVLFYPQNLSILSKLRFLLEGVDRPDIQVDHWGLDFDPGDGTESFTLDRTYGDLGRLSDSLVEYAKTDEDLRALIPSLPHLKSEQQNLCAVLSTRSR